MSAIPNLYIPGAAKSATSYLFACLGSSNDIFAPKLKEMHFHASDSIGLPLKNSDPFKKYEPHIVNEKNKYLEYFSDYAGQKYLLDCSPTYMMYKGTAKKIKTFCKNAKIIISLRNPIDRAFSQYKMNVRINCENLTFEQALKAEEERLSKNYFRATAYKTVGLYSHQVKEYLDTFGPSDVKFILYEDIASDPLKVVSDICSWLDIEFSPKMIDNKVRNYTGFPQNRLVNKIAYSGIVRKVAKAIIKSRNLREIISDSYIKSNNQDISMDPAVRKILQDYYEEDIRKLAQYSYLDLEDWLDRKDIS